MILLFSTDAAIREKNVRLWRSYGIECAAPRPVEFLALMGEPSVRAVVFDPPDPTGFSALLPRGVALFTVGTDPTGSSLEFPYADSPALLCALEAISGDFRQIGYSNLLWTDEVGVIFIGYRMRLTAEERALLSYLVRHRDRPVPVGELAAFCLGRGDLPPAQTDRRIASLNRKAAAIGGRTMIDAVPLSRHGAYQLNEFF